MSGLRPYLPLIILVGILVVVLGTGLFLITAGKGIGQFFFGRTYAESELKDYVATVLKENLRGASCQPFDTDDNGYVSCDYTVSAQPGITRSIECAAFGIGGFINRGCRTRLPNFQTN
ncbi:hypothetical protein [Gloeobacter kilaueensis]|uniref:Uncharacterized protein n=1 Tax=Gloeobacter kilaueensis (strain ATCC BAA-2537 / CCAP 1431/1 / ULC 316 / JS1) TaxID=1183438 RepID=U5QF92_GLOK1|nr:hypothetical protein [Gloeobacter kilaueensis]AGY57606.1 hypothetical protein GKIL_1360 [Gloeobacter kilaueensis JS1]